MLASNNKGELYIAIITAFAYLRCHDNITTECSEKNLFVDFQ